MPRHLPQIGGDQVGQDGLDLGAPLRLQQAAQKRVVLHRVGEKRVKRLVRRFGLHAPLSQLLGVLLGQPLQHVHEIAEVVVERLPGDVAGVNQRLHRDFVHVPVLHKL